MKNILLISIGLIIVLGMLEDGRRRNRTVQAVSALIVIGVWIALCWSTSTVLIQAVTTGALPRPAVVAYVPLSMLALLSFMKSPGSQLLPRLVWIYYLIDVIWFGWRNPTLFPKSGHMWLDLILFVFVLDLGWQLISLPFQHYTDRCRAEGFNLKLWLHKRLKLFAITLTRDFVILGALFAIVQAQLPYWWLAGAAAFFIGDLLMTASFAGFLELWVEHVKPMQDIPPRLALLVERSGLKSTRIVEFNSRHRFHSSGWVCSIGKIITIGLEESLLKDHPSDEVEFVIAHELSHALTQDCFKDLVLHTAITGIALMLFDLMVRLHFGANAWSYLGDLANLPALLLAVHLTCWLLSWIELSYSRFCETRANLNGLNLTRNPDGMRNFFQHYGPVCAKQLPLLKRLCLTHPPARDCIAMADRWEKAH